VNRIFKKRIYFLTATCLIGGIMKKIIAKKEQPVFIQIPSFRPIQTIDHGSSFISLAPLKVSQVLSRPTIVRPKARLAPRVNPEYVFNKVKQLSLRAKIENPPEIIQADRFNYADISSIMRSMMGVGGVYFLGFQNAEQVATKLTPIAHAEYFATQLLSTLEVSVPKTVLKSGSDRAVLLQHIEDNLDKDSDLKEELTEKLRIDQPFLMMEFINGKTVQELSSQKEFWLQPHILSSYGEIVAADILYNNFERLPTTYSLAPISNLGNLMVSKNQFVCVDQYTYSPISNISIQGVCRSIDNFLFGMSQDEQFLYKRTLAPVLKKLGVTLTDTEADECQEHLLDGFNKMLSKIKLLTEVRIDSLLTESGFSVHAAKQQKSLILKTQALLIKFLN
jgi:hypothetical protein